MNISYQSNEVEKLCTKAGRAQKKLGALAAKALLRRLGELDYLDSVGDLLVGPGNWEVWKHRERTVTAHLGGGFRIVIEVTDVEQADILAGSEATIMTIDRHYKKLG